MDNTVLTEDPEKYEFLRSCHIQASMKCHKHIYSVLTILKKRLVGLTKLKYICPLSLRKKITEGIFNSVLVYCLPLYGGLDTGDLQDLQVLQNKAAQIVTLSPPRSSRAPMFDRLGWLSVNQSILYHTVISRFKISCSKETEELSSILTRDSRFSRIIIPNLDLSPA